MANTYVNKVQLADGTSLIDISDSTATADKILQGYTAYGADGAKLTGTATGGGGSVTQDQDGFIVLPPTGGGSPSVSGLEYETGTWTPSEDVARGEISFSNAHTLPPSLVVIADCSSPSTSVTGNNIYTHYFDSYRLFGSGFPRAGSTTGVYYGVVDYNHYGGSQRQQFTINSDNTSGSSASDPRYWADNEKIYPYTNSTSRYWRAGRTYKWIAVWAPTT